MTRKIKWFYIVNTGVIAITIEFYHEGQNNKLFNFDPDLQYILLTWLGIGKIWKETKGHSFNNSGVIALALETYLHAKAYKGLSWPKTQLFGYYN